MLSRSVRDVMETHVRGRTHWCLTKDTHIQKEKDQYGEVHIIHLTKYDTLCYE